MEDQNTSHYKQPGEYIDRFQILSVLGAGGMGVVYKAYDPNLNKDVAIKLVNNELASAQLHIRFQQEAKALRDLKHPAIPEIYDFAISEDQEPFMIIDFIEGKSLFNYLEKKGKLTLKEAFEILEPLCEALKYAHDHSIVHRDVKPDNIILNFDQSGKPLIKIIDFGLAHLDEDLSKSQAITKTGNVLGSPKYMSPEQAKGNKATPASDIYSVGCILFEMLAGRPPFDGDNPLKIISAHVTDDVEDQFKALPEELLENKELTTLFSKCLAKNPEDRFEEIDEVSRAVRNILSVRNNPVIDVPEMEPTNISVNALVKPVLKWGFAICLGTMAVSALIFWYLRMQQEPEVRQYIPASDKVRQYMNETGFKHIPKKGEGYYIGAANVTDSDFAGLLRADPPPLNVVSGKSDTVTGQGVYYLRKTNLYRIDLASEKLGDIALKNASLIPSLIDLSVGETDKLTNEGFKNLLRTKLTILRVENCKLQPGVIETISQLNSLQSLSLQGSKPLTDNDLITLSKLENLNSLAIDYTGITPEGLRNLFKFKNLTSLKCEFLGIEDKHAPILANLHLVSLDISDNKLTARGLKRLTKSKYLKLVDCSNQMWINDKSIDPKEKEEMKEALRKAAVDFRHSNPQRQIRWELRRYNPCK